MSDFHPDFSQVLTRDLHFLRQAYRQPSRFGGLEKVQKKYHQSHALFLKRQKNLPQPQFDNSLPVHQKIDEITHLLQKHQVVIICGQTGSGKTTQLPKICLSIGRGISGLIAHTQPRRLAARSVAERIAEELGENLGKSVGCKIRFQENTSPESCIKVMTDGILLAETAHDRYLNAYDTLIIDEAHERSLNIDFLLGYIQKILPKRRDLKVIITSATLDTAHLQQYFNNAPLVEVSGRTYPVEIRYRPQNGGDEDEQDVNLSDAVCAAADELSDEGNGDILVFLPGEREIRDAAEALRKSRPMDDILPLFARLSMGDQQKIFHPQSNRRRIVLSTNVAETSLTVPGIRYVIDSGLARIKRYSAHSKVELLHIEKIAQSSANQRSGRCGRLSSGICIRLYDEADFLARDEFSTPEILRSNLASVILRLMSLKLGDITSFPFLDAPENRLISDGIQTLFELGALDGNRQLTDIGRQMAALPIDPKIARILIAAQQYDCVEEILTIASSLSVPDVREKPFAVREEAQRAHAIFADPKSDFLSYLNIWNAFAKVRAECSNKEMNQWCHRHFLSYVRLREWRDLRRQLAQICIETGIHSAGESLCESKRLSVENEKRNESLHRALLTGLVTQVGMKSPEGSEYIGARANRFYISSSSGLFKGKAKWIMASGLTDTGKLFARDVAAIAPEWIEQAAMHLMSRHYLRPHWDVSRGEVIAAEKVTFYGLTVINGRNVSYGRIDKTAAREIFIREALVAPLLSDEKMIKCHSSVQALLQTAFFRHNQKLIQEIIYLEHKSRRQDVLVDDETLFAFYHQNIPPISDECAIVDAPSFNHWLKKTMTTQQDVLHLDKPTLMRHAAAHITEEQFPEFLRTDNGQFALSYRFEPNHPLDGVSVRIALTELNRINAARLQWLVPGMIREKLSFIIKSLPKQIRRLCVPVPDFITRFLSNHPDIQQGIHKQLARQIAQEVGNMHLLDDIDFDLWEQASLPEHCLMRLEVVDDAGNILGEGRNIALLRERLGKAAAVTFRDHSQEFERENLTQWNIGTLPECIHFARGKQQMTGFLALQREKDNSIALRLFDTELSAQNAHREGVIALMQIQLKDHMKDLNKGITGLTSAAMVLKFIGIDQLRSQMIHAICDRAFIGEDSLPRDEKSFKEQIKRAKVRLPAVKEAVSQRLNEITDAYVQLNGKLGKHPLTARLRERIGELLPENFAHITPWDSLSRLPIYLKAMTLRLEKYSANPARDAAREDEIRALETLWRHKIENLQKSGTTPSDNLMNFRWQIEELRVSLFAQELKTPKPVSVKRLMKEWELINKI